MAPPIRRRMMPTQSIHRARSRIGSDTLQCRCHRLRCQTMKPHTLFFDSLTCVFHAAPDQASACLVVKLFLTVTCWGLEGLVQGILMLSPSFHRTDMRRDMHVNIDLQVGLSRLSPKTNLGKGPRFKCAVGGKRFQSGILGATKVQTVRSKLGARQPRRSACSAASCTSFGVQVRGSFWCQISSHTSSGEACHTPAAAGAL